MVVYRFNLCPASICVATDDGWTEATKQNDPEPWSCLTNTGTFSVDTYLIDTDEDTNDDKSQTEHL